MSRIALSFGRMTRSVLLKNNINKAAKLQAGDLFHGILLDNDPAMEFYSRESITAFIHTPIRSAIGEQWKYQKKGTKEIMANVRGSAKTLSVELTRKDISYFKSKLLPLLPDSFLGRLLRYPDENEEWTKSSFASCLNSIRQSDDFREHALTDELVRKINLLLSLNCPSC
jgi:hypothetical protein